MAGPISGLGNGAQQQSPFATSFKPGQNTSNTNDVRQPDKDALQPQENTVQPRGGQAAEAQTAQNGNEDVSRDLLSPNLAKQPLAEDQISKEERGSLLDIEV